MDIYRRLYGLLARRIVAIKSQGPSKAVSDILLLCKVVIALQLVLIVRIVKPVVHIRFGALRSERIGHFAFSTELYLCKKELDKPKRAVDIFFHGEPVSNHQLKKMWDRILITSKWVELPYKINRLVSSSAEYEAPIPNDRDVEDLLSRATTHLFLTPEEEMRGEIGLREMGIPENARFVCFIARDSRYLETILPGQDWSYHDFRNADVNNYLPALEELTSKGYYCLRMGALVASELNTDNPMIIDYAKNYRTDFLDIYLSARCNFFVSSSTGIDGVAMAFRRPLVLVNYIPLEYVWTWMDPGLYITKKLWLRDDRRFMTFPEIVKSGVGRFTEKSLYESKGIDIIDNTSEEIADVVREMESRLSGTWETSVEDDDLQNTVTSLLSDSNLHGKIVSKMGSSFLRQNRNLLLD